MSSIKLPFLEPMRAMFHIDLNLGREYEWWIHELEQTIIVFGIVHLLQVLQDPNREFLNDEFVQAVVFMLVGFSFYFLVWKKFVKFVYDDDDKIEGFRNTFRLFR